MSDLEKTILDIISDGRARCGAGWGKYPLGVRTAVGRLVKLLETPAITAAVKDFDERLSR